jgi:hypothetical protein
VTSRAADTAEGGGIGRWNGRTRQHGSRKRELTCGARMAVIGERKDVTTGMSKPDEEAPFWRIRQGASGLLD